MVEATIAVAVVSTMVVAALHTFGASARAREIHARLNVAPGLARELMDEILQACYEESGASKYSVDDGGGSVTITSSTETAAVFGRESDEQDGTRRAFDDVDDYDGWSSTPPVDRDGATLPGFEGWTRSVAVEHLNSWTLSQRPNEGGLRRVTVTASDPQGRTTTLSALRAAESTYERTPLVETTVARWIGIELQVGASGAILRSGVATVNQAEVPTP